MSKARSVFYRPSFIATLVLLATCGVNAIGQDRDSSKSKSRGQAKPVTVPVTIVTKPGKEMQVADFIVREDGEMQEQISIRRPNETPLTVCVLLQDDLVSSVASETKGIAEFVRQLPSGSRVMIGYIRAGSLEVRRKFTGEVDRAAASMRPPLGLASAGPYNPFVEITEALKRFDSQPAGRRAIIVVSDGLDLSRGLDNASPTQSVDLQHAIREAQRRAVPIYSIYAPSAATAAGSNQLLSSYGQSSLERLSSETGGRAYFQGTGAPISFDHFLTEIDGSLKRQIALTYLSTHGNKGFHRLDIKPLDNNIQLRHPAGYTR